jgi:hypothetical protein
MAVTTSVILICLRIIPIILFLGSIFAFLNRVNVGPREMPRQHPLNRKMALPVLIISIGMFMISLPDQFGMLGIGLSFVGLVWYAIYFKRARDEFPAMNDGEWLAKVKGRYTKEPEPAPEDQIFELEEGE